MEKNSFNPESFKEIMKSFKDMGKGGQPAMMPDMMLAMMPEELGKKLKKKMEKAFTGTKAATHKPAYKPTTSYTGKPTCTTTSSCTPKKSPVHKPAYKTPSSPTKAPTPVVQQHVQQGGVCKKVEYQHIFVGKTCAPMTWNYSKGGYTGTLRRDKVEDHGTWRKAYYSGTVHKKTPTCYKK